MIKVLLSAEGESPTRRTLAISTVVKAMNEDDDVRALNHGSAYVTTFAYPSVLCCLAGRAALAFYGHLQETGRNTSSKVCCCRCLKLPVLDKSLKYLCSTVEHGSV